MTHETKTWLVAHDFSDCAAAAADTALDDLLGSARGGRIILFHSYAVMLPGAAIEGGAVAAGFMHLERAALAEATASLERAAQTLRARVESSGRKDVQIDVLARLGTAAESILAEADSLNASRIIVGTHGYSGINHFLLGSVAERVARRARVPVLVVHQKNNRKTQQKTPEKTQGQPGSAS